MDVKPPECDFALCDVMFLDEKKKQKALELEYLHHPLLGWLPWTGKQAGRQGPGVILCSSQQVPLIYQFFMQW